MFREVQGFHPLASVLVLAVGVGLPLAILLNSPEPVPPAGWTAVAVGNLVALGFVFFCRLVTTVRDGELRVRLVPFPGRTIRLEEVESAEVRTYRPLREYGGWGLRYTTSAGWAYNARGDRGVQVVTRDGTRVLVGSQRPAELLTAIREGSPVGV